MTIIYLDRLLLNDSSSLPESHNVADHHCFLLGLAPNGVYLALQVTRQSGKLLPYRFTLTTRRLNARSAVYFLWHFP